MTGGGRPTVICHGPDGPTTGPPAAGPAAAGPGQGVRARAGDGVEDGGDTEDAGSGAESAGGGESRAGAAAYKDTAAPAADLPGAERLPPPGHADVQIVAASPGVARRVAEALRLRFAASEQRSYAAGDESGGTMLHLTVDTVHLPQTAGPFQLRLVGGRSATVDAVVEPVAEAVVEPALPAVRKRASAESRRRPPHPPTPDAPSGDRPTP